MANPKTYTDDELEQALIRANGQPTKAAKILGVEYVGVYLRIRANPKLMDVQIASRAKTFQDLSEITMFAIKSGYIQKHLLDGEGKVTNDIEFVEIDERTRVDSALKLMNMLKGEDGVIVKSDLTTNGKSLNTSFHVEVIDRRENVENE